ncbi:DUF3515 family protein [Micromonospora sp. NPDC049559]|uniref:DUF3515 family protein n=1 Tax=Micromonospora sp. NPDC049559 TaxID=3155923 RepID=UPI003426C0FA
MEPQTSEVERDSTTRQAALWATVVAVPLALVVAIVAIVSLSPGEPAAAPTASASATASPGPRSTAPVAMAAPPLAERPATVCRALVSQLPDTIRDLAQRPVRAGAEQNAAYGDPAVTVACGVPPASYPPTDTLWVVNGTCWYPSDQSDAVVLTTVDREVPIRVTLPRAYDQAAQWATVTALSESVVSSVPSVKPLPYGCTG